MAKQQSSPNNRRGEMIYCERCGEDYSATYRRCPFCDERPGRRIDDHGYAARSPLQLAMPIGSLVVILAAAFIVFSKVAPLLSSKDPAPDPGVDDPGVVDPVDPVLPSDPQPEGPDVVEPVNPSAVPANAIVLSRTDMTLAPNEDFTILATVAPADTTDTVVWSCDKPDILAVNQDGSVKNMNATGEKVVVNVTATAGGITAECIVRCNSAPNPNGGSGSSNEGSGGSSGSTGTTITGKTNAKVVGAASGLNVRSGPGSNYEKVASIQNGNSVVILEDTGTGWYKIDYGNGKTGYASSQFIQPK